MGLSAANALWVVEALLFYLLLRLIRDRRRLEELHETALGGSSGSTSGLSPREQRLREQWPKIASELRAEGKSAAEIELVRKQVFSSS